MTKIIVIYKSKYGSTKKYAGWIAEELSADLRKHSEMDLKKLLQYDTIVYGGGLYAVGISGIKIITDNYKDLQGKKIVIFSVGASPAYEKAIEAVKAKNIPPEMIGNVDYFHLRGSFNFKLLNATDKILMYLLKITLKRKKTLNNEEKGMLHTYDNPADWTNRKAIEPIVNAVKN